MEILNKKTVESSKIEIQILLNNGEISWEPLSVIRKDDPVTVAKYTREKILKNQRGWKWTKHIIKVEEKLIRFLKTMKNTGKY